MKFGPSFLLLRGAEARPDYADIVAKVENRAAPKISQKLIFGWLPTAILRSAHTKLRGRFCVKRCGPSYRRVRNASAVLKNFCRHPKKTFCNTICPLADTGLGVGVVILRWFICCGHCALYLGR